MQLSREPRLVCDPVVQLSCASDSSHPGSARSKHGAKASLLSHTVETGLLQRASVWCPNRGGVEAAAPAEQRIVLKADQRCDAGLQLNWLPVESRLRFKIALLTDKVRLTSTPSYLSSIITTKRSTGYSLRSSSAPQLTVTRVKTEFAIGVLFVSLHLRFGMFCQSIMYNVVSQYMFLNRDSKLFFLTVHLYN